MLEPSGHFSAPNSESEGHEQSRDKDEDAHQNAHQNVNECGEKCGVPSSPKELDESSELDEGNDKHDDGDKYREIAIGLGRPIHTENRPLFLTDALIRRGGYILLELAVLLLPNSGRE